MRLEAALNLVIAQHPGLPSHFFTENGRMHQIARSAHERVSLEIHELHEPRGRAREEAVTARAARLQRGLDPMAGALMRMALFRFDRHENGRLLMVFHHLIMDVVSLRIFTEDLAEAYDQLSRGSSVRLPAPTAPFPYWANRLAAYAASPRLAAELDFWLGLPWSAAKTLPPDFAAGRARNTVAESCRHTLILSPEETLALTRRATPANGFSMEDALLFAFVKSLCARVGGSVLLLEMERHGREPLFEEVDLSRSIGWFTVLYPLLPVLAPGLEPERAVMDLARQRQRVPNGGIGFGLLRYATPDQAARAKLAALPKPQIRFNYLGRFDRDFSRGFLMGPASEATGADEDPAAERAYLLEWDGWIGGGRLHTRWTYANTVRGEPSIATLATAFRDNLRLLFASETPAVPRMERDSDRLPRGGPCPVAVRPASPAALPHDGAHLEARYPLSPLQEGLFFHVSQKPDGGPALAYINQLSLTLAGALDPAAFKSAWRQAVDRHPILRTSFHGHLGRPLQAVHRRLTLPWREADWRAVAAAEKPACLRRLLAADRAQPFPLDRAPLMRMTLIRLEDHVRQWIWTYHHLLLDGWSSAMLLREVFDAYAALVRGDVFRAPPRLPFQAYVAWLSRQGQTEAERFWAQSLRGFSEITVLPREPESAGAQKPERHQQGRLFHPLPHALNRSLRLAASRYRVTPYTLFLGAWALLSAHLSSQRDLVFGTVQTSRPTGLDGAETALGPLIQTLPLRVRVSRKITLNDWLQKIFTDRL